MSRTYQNTLLTPDAVVELVQSNPAGVLSEAIARGWAPRKVAKLVNMIAAADAAKDAQARIAVKPILTLVKDEPTPKDRATLPRAADGTALSTVISAAQKARYLMGESSTYQSVKAEALALVNAGLL